MRHEGRPGVEADPRFADDERVLAETLVGQGIRNDEHVVLLDRVRAKGDAARGFGRADAHA